MNKKKFLSKINSKVCYGIAHRGYWNEKFTENSLGAFKEAINHDIAFELDVHLSKDNQLIVCHDDDLIRTTGKKGIIEELTVEEIKNNYRLLDGSLVPTFQEVLDLNKEKVPIICELKVHNKNYKPLAKRFIEESKQIKDHKNLMIISFDPRALLFAKKSGFVNSLLVTINHHWVYKLRYFFDSLDLEYNMFEEKSVKKYAKKHFVNLRTIESLEIFEKLYKEVDTLTCQKFDLNVAKERFKNKTYEM